jgi:hypothetical protein
MGSAIAGRATAALAIVLISISVIRLCVTSAQAAPYRRFGPGCDPYRLQGDADE